MLTSQSFVQPSLRHKFNDHHHPCVDNALPEEIPHVYCSQNNVDAETRLHEMK